MGNSNQTYEKVEDPQAEENNRIIWSDFYDVCMSGNLKKVQEFIFDYEVTSEKTYVDLFILQIKHGKEGTDLLVDLYNTKKYEILDYILDLKWKTALYINHLFYVFVENNEYERLKQLDQNHSVCGLGFADHDLYRMSFKTAVLNNNYMMATYINMKTYRQTVKHRDYLVNVYAEYKNKYGNNLNPDMLQLLGINN
jgi:hypothetical protein